MTSLFSAISASSKISLPHISSRSLLTNLLRKELFPHFFYRHLLSCEQLESGCPLPEKHSDSSCRRAAACLFRLSDKQRLPRIINTSATASSGRRTSSGTGITFSSGLIPARVALIRISALPTASLSSCVSLQIIDAHAADPPELPCGSSPLSSHRWRKTHPSG